MRKIIKNIALFCLVFLVSIIFIDRAYAYNSFGECKDMPLDACEKRIDTNGNACTIKGVNRNQYCDVNTEAKKCNEYTEYHSVDDYGNSCGRDTNGGGFYTKVSACEYLTTKDACENSSNNCSWIAPGYGGANIGVDGVIACFKVTTPTSKSKACGEITSSNTCNLRTDCTYLNGKCTQLFDSSTTPKSCYEVNGDDVQKAEAQCKSMKDSDGNSCEGEIVKGHYFCYPQGTTGNDRFTGKDFDISFTDVEFKCSDVRHLTGIWLAIRIIAPFLVILFGSLDFFKSMIANDEKQMRQARGKFIKRLIAFLLLIILPFIVQFIFSTMGTYGSENVCLVKCIATNDTSEKGCD